MDKNLKSFLLIILTCFFIASRTSGTSFQEKSLHGTPAKPPTSHRSGHKKRGTHSRICSGAAVPQFWNISWCQAMHPAPVGSKN